MVRASPAADAAAQPSQTGIDLLETIEALDAPSGTTVTYSSAKIRVKVGSHDVKDLCGYLGEICGRILDNWEDLEKSEVDGKPAIFVVGRMLRILANLSFLFDADQHPEHVRLLVFFTADSVLMKQIISISQRWMLYLKPAGKLEDKDANARCVAFTNLVTLLHNFVAHEFSQDERPFCKMLVSSESLYSFLAVSVDMVASEFGASTSVQSVMKKTCVGFWDAIVNWNMVDSSLFDSFCEIFVQHPFLESLVLYLVKNADNEESLNLLAILFVAKDFVPRFLKSFSAEARGHSISMIFRCLTSAIPKSPKASHSSHKLLIENIVALAEDDAGRRTLLQEWKGDFLKLITLLVDHTQTLEIDEVDIPNDHQASGLAVVSDFAARYLGLVFRMYGVMQKDSSFASILVAHFRGKKGGLEKLLAHLIMLQQHVDSQTRATSKIAKGQGGNFERLLSVIEQHLGSKGKMDVDNAVGSGKQAKGVSSAKNGGEVEQGSPTSYGDENIARELDKADEIDESEIEMAAPASSPVEFSVESYQAAGWKASGAQAQVRQELAQTGRKRGPRKRQCDEFNRATEASLEHEKREKIKRKVPQFTFEYPSSPEFIDPDDYLSDDSTIRPVVGEVDPEPIPDDIVALGTAHVPRGKATQGRKRKVIGTTILDQGGAASLTAKNVSTLEGQPGAGNRVPKGSKATGPRAASKRAVADSAGAPGSSKPGSSKMAEGAGDNMNMYEDDSLASAAAILAGSRSADAPDGIQEALDRELQRVQGAGGAGGGAREGGAGGAGGGAREGGAGGAAGGTREGGAGGAGGGAREGGAGGAAGGTREGGAGGAGGGAREGGAEESNNNNNNGAAAASTGAGANQDGSWRGVEGQATATPSVTELHQQMMHQHLQQQHSLLLAATQGVPSHLAQQAQLPGAMTSQAQNHFMIQNLLRQQMMEGAMGQNQGFQPDVALLSQIYSMGMMQAPAAAGPNPMAGCFWAVPGGSQGIVRPQFVDAGSIPGAGGHAHTGDHGQDNEGGVAKAPPPIQSFKMVESCKRKRNMRHVEIAKSIRVAAEQYASLCAAFVANLQPH